MKMEYPSDNLQNGNKDESMIYPTILLDQTLPGYQLQLSNIKK